LKFDNMPLPPETEQTTDEVFNHFNNYLDKKLAEFSGPTSQFVQESSRTKKLERQSDAQNLTHAGNKDQFLFNAELADWLWVKSGILLTSWTQKVLQTSLKRPKIVQSTDRNLYNWPIRVRRAG